MDKYIKVQDLIDRICPIDPENDGSDGCTVAYQNITLSIPEIEAIVEDMPAAIVDLLKYGTPYCPNCGAKMDAET